MKHLEASFIGKNNFWRYFIMLVVVFFASNFIGGIPAAVTTIINSNSNPDDFQALASNPNDYNALLGVGQNAGLILMLIPFIFGLLAFIFTVKPLHERTIYHTINGTKSIRWNHFLISALIWAILSAIYLFAYLKYDPSNFSLNNTSGTLIPLIIISIMLIPFQATFEELLFRGYLMQGFTVLFKSRWLPLLATSVLFGLMHSLNPEVESYGFLTMMPQYITFGLIFGIVAIMDDGIEAAMGAHTANNAFLCIMLTNKSSALQTPALYVQHTIYPWTELAGMLISGIIFVIFLKVIFKWDKFSVLLGEVQPAKENYQIP